MIKRIDQSGLVLEVDPMIEASPSQIDQIYLDLEDEYLDVEDESELEEEEKPTEPEELRVNLTFDSQNNSFVELDLSESSSSSESDTDAKEAAAKAARKENELMLHALRVSRVSNALLLIGGSAFTGFVTREIITACRRDSTADYLYWTASGSFMLSGFIQMLLDAAWCRKIPEGRYSTNRFMNLFITMLFLAGVGLDFYAFLFWRQGTAEAVGKERRIQWISSHLWLLASLVVILTSLRRSGKLEDKLDVVGNIFFLWESAMNVCARYVADRYPVEGETIDPYEMWFELAAAIFWTYNAFFYLLGDSIRIRNAMKRSRGKSPKQNDNDDSSSTSKENTTNENSSEQSSEA